VVVFWFLHFESAWGERALTTGRVVPGEKPHA
jgi:hypothetical protein